MINTKEYQHLIFNCQDIFKKITIDWETSVLFDDIRTLYKKYKKEVDYRQIYPHANMDEARRIGEELKMFCKMAQIKLIFFSLESVQSKEGEHTMFVYQNVNISKLIMMP